MARSCWAHTWRHLTLPRILVLGALAVAGIQVVRYWQDDSYLLSNMTIVQVAGPGDGRRNLMSKYELAWRYVYSRYGHLATWFLKADDDTFILVDNLRTFLSDKDPQAPEYYGHIYCEPYQRLLFNNGGSGYVLSRHVLGELVTAYDQYPHCHPPGHGADWKDAQCLLAMGIKPADTRDSRGRERFLSLPLKDHILGITYDGLRRYWELNTNIIGANCCSDELISIHALSSGDMMSIRFWLHLMQPLPEDNAESGGDGNWLPPLGDKYQAWSRLWYSYKRMDKT